MAVATRPVAVAPSPSVSTPPDRQRATLIGGALLLLVAAATRFVAIDSQSLWYDEGVSAGMVGQGPASIIRQAAADFHPPLYYLLLAAWARLFGDSVVALRGLSAVAGILLVFLTWRLATRLFGAVPGWFAAVWAIVAPLGIAFSQELRMYMPVAACVALAGYYALCWLDVGVSAPSEQSLPTRGSLRPYRYLAGYALAATVALYLQYVAALGLAAIGLYGLLRAGGRSLPLWLAANAVSLLLFAPWLPVFHHQLAVGRTATTTHTSAGQVVAAATGSLLVGADGLPIWNRAAVTAVAAVVLLGGRKSLTGGWRNTLPVLLVVVPVVGVTAYAAWKAVYEVRYVLVALPGVAMLGGLGILECARLGSVGVGRLLPHRRTTILPALIVAGAVVAATGAADLRYYVAPLHPHDDYRGLAAAITRQGQSGDAVLLYPPGQNNVFGYYYRGPDPVVGLPVQRPPDAADVTTQLASLFRSHPRVWVVEYGASEADPAGIVSAWLGQHAFLAEHQWFGSPQLLLYVAQTGLGVTVPSATHFSNSAELQSFSVAPSKVAPGGTVEITLNWRAQTAIAASYTVFTHLLDPANHVVAQHDGLPAGGTRPTSGWKPGDVVRDMHAIVLPANLTPGAYTIEVGMYLPNGGARAQIIDARGAVSGDRVVLGSVVVAKPVSR